MHIGEINQIYYTMHICTIIPMMIILKKNKVNKKNGFLFLFWGDLTQPEL
jgi:hypothetical protein